MLSWATDSAQNGPSEVSFVNAPHRPVLLDRVVELLAPRPGHRVVDGTLGAGGHAEALLEAILPAGRLFGIDRDPEALALAGRRLARFGDAFVPLRGRHEDLGRLLDEAGVTSVNAVLLDLGLSSMQIDRPERGFSFRADGPLDMRMDPDVGPTAADLIADLDEAELKRLLWTRGEERHSGRIARAIVRERGREPIRTTRRLAEIVERAAGPEARRYRIHPATRTFQALRVAVNREIEGLEQALSDAIDRLAPGGRIAVLSYQSQEDRAVKRVFRELSEAPPAPRGLPLRERDEAARPLRRVTRKAERPDDREIEANPRARSARLRVAEKTGHGEGSR